VDPKKSCLVTLAAMPEGSAVSVPDPNDHHTRAAYVQATV